MPMTNIMLNTAEPTTAPRPMSSWRQISALITYHINIIINNEFILDKSICIHKIQYIVAQCSAQVFKRAGCHLKRAQLAR